MEVGHSYAGAIPMNRYITVFVLALATVGSYCTEPEKPHVVAFQQGVDGYSGTVDTEIWALATTTILESNPNASSDANNDGGESQVLLRFDEIIGAKARQIPPQS